MISDEGKGGAGRQQSRRQPKRYFARTGNNAVMRKLTIILGVALLVMVGTGGLADRCLRNHVVPSSDEDGAVP